MRKSTTKRALIASVLSLVMCFGMLTGTTFAWFTDTVTSGTNIIAAGNLDVELYNGDEQIKGEDTDPKFFNDVAAGLWEPGAMAWETFTVKNVGTLALKYTLEFNVTDPANGVSLAKALKIALADAEPTARPDPSAYEWKPFETFVLVGELDLVNATEESYTLIVWWEPSDNDNDYNMNNDKQGTASVEFNLVLKATQLASENDAFGPAYDKDAVYADKTYVVEGTGTLADTLASINAAQDKTVLVQLDADVTWATGGAHGSTPWVDENSAVNNLIIDAQGKTITATGSGVGPIRMANGGTLTIKNAKIVDNSESYAEGSWEFGYLEFAGDIVFENVEFVNAIMMDGESATFKNCTFNSNKDSEYGVWVSNGNATFTGCTFAGPRGLKTHEAYGSEVGTIVVDNCTFDNLTKKPGMAIGTVNADTTVTIKNSDFINCQAGDQGKFIYESDTDVTTFNFDCSENNEVITVVTPDLVITTAEELFAFANSVNVDGNRYSGKLVVLGADIDLANAEWTPVGQTGGNGVATYFQGMFDGKGYTIKNLKVTDNAYDEGANYAAGFFGFIDSADAQIVNLTIDGANVNGHHWTGVIAGYLTGKISNCTVKNATVSCTHANDDACGDKAGVIVGYVNTGVVTNNLAENSTVTAGRDAGQIAGCAKVTYVYGNTAINVTVTAAGNCTGANIRNEEIGRLN